MSGHTDFWRNDLFTRTGQPAPGNKTFGADRYQRLLDSPEIPEATKTKLRADHARLDPFALKKSIEVKLKKFFTALGNLDRESTKT